MRPKEQSLVISPLERMPGYRNTGRKGEKRREEGWMERRKERRKRKKKFLELRKDIGKKGRKAGRMNRFY